MKIKSLPDWVLERIRDTLRYENGNLIWTKPTSRRVHPGDIAGSVTAQGDIAICFKHRDHGQCVIHAHRVIWMIHHNYEWPRKVIRHRDGNRQNNRIGNLTDASLVGRRYTRMARCIYQCHRRFRLRFQRSGKTISLGTFPTLDDAIVARDLYLQTEREERARKIAA